MQIVPVPLNPIQVRDQLEMERYHLTDDPQQCEVEPAEGLKRYVERYGKGDKGKDSN
jgi:hypothetical protein